MDHILDREPKQLLRSTSLLSSSRHHTSISEAWQPPPSRDSTASSTVSTNNTEGRMRKRHSFFTRSQSETPKLRRTPSTLALSPISNGHQESSHRPGTSQSSRRRKTEHLESLRNSIFGGKKKTHVRESSASPVAGKSDSRASEPDTHASRTHFKTEEDCEYELSKQDDQLTDSRPDYHHLRKASISPPFNFEHVTHTARKHLPALETVNEKDLKAEFWGSQAYQRPKQFLNGIQADDLSAKLPRMGVERHSPSSRPTSPVPAEACNQIPYSPTSPRRRFFGATDASKTSIDETVFDEVRETKFDPDVALHTLHSDRQYAFRLPKKYSSMGAIRETRESVGTSDWPFSPDNVKKSNRESYVQMPPPPTTFYESGNSDSDAPSDHTLPRREKTVIMTPNSAGSPSFSSKGEGTQHTNEQAEDSPSAQDAQATTISPQQSETAVPDEVTSPQAEFIDRSKQPLPPVPTQQRPASLVSRRSHSSVRMSKSRAASTVSLASSERPSSIRSRSSKSIRKSPAVESTATSTSSLPNRSSILSETWEDEIDFLYEQNAESTCNFDWEQGQMQPSLEQGVMDLRLSGGAPMGAASSPVGVRKLSADERVASLVSQDGNTHSRGSSVGHRGFLAARRGSRSGSKHGSSDMLHKQMTAPPPLDFTPTPSFEVTPTSPTVNVLSPVLSIRGEEGSATSAVAAVKSGAFSPSTLHFHNFDSTNRGSAEYVSDPESNVTRRSKHSKSSSYGSYDSTTRSTPSSGSRDTARWSSASSASVPELMHSHKRRSKASLHKSIISRPLESLPQSPGPAEETADDGIVPRASQVEPMRNTFIMRRPETTSDRTILQNAGRAVQRGRPSTPGRLGLFPRVASVEETEPRHRRAVSAGPEPPGAGWL